MDVLGSLLTESSLGTGEASMLALLLLFVPTILFFRARVRAGKEPRLRPIPAYDHLHTLVGMAAETGHPLSVTLGSGTVGQTATAETLAALYLLDGVGEEAVSNGAPTLVTAGDPTVLLAAQGVRRGHYEAQGLLEEYDHLAAQLVAPEPAAYAAGVMDLVGHQPPVANVLAGHFGDEYLLMAEAGVQAGLDQVAGAVQPATLPFVYATTDRPVLGEELFAAGAYLRGLPGHVGSLLAQDWMRVLLILIIVVGIAVTTLFG